MAEKTIGTCTTSAPEKSAQGSGPGRGDAWPDPSEIDGQTSTLPDAAGGSPRVGETAAGEAASGCEQRYKRLLAAANDYIFSVVVENGQAVATTHGPGCVAVTGYTAREFASDPNLWYEIIHEEDREAVLAQVASVLRGETPRALEHRILHKDGRVRWIRNLSVPHLGKDGKVVAYDGLISDITQRKQGEQILVLHHDITCDLAEAETLPDALGRVLKTLCRSFLWDLAAFWRWVPVENALRCDQTWHVRSVRLERFAALLQAAVVVPGTELPGAAWTSAKPRWIADLREDHESPRAPQAQKAGLRGACAFPIRRGREVVGVVELFSREVQQHDRHMLAALAAVGTEIGQFIERKRAEEALKKTLADLAASHEQLQSTQLELVQSSKMETLGTLAAGIAHEVKNPLATVLMGLGYLSGHCPAEEAAVRETLDVMRDAVQRADSIVREMLRLAAGTKLDIAAEDLNQVVERALALVRYPLNAAGISVTREFGAGLPLVSLDRTKMEQVFINLFLNALHAMPQGGTLTLRTRAAQWGSENMATTGAAARFDPSDTVVIAEVQDTGPGIPEAHLGKLFTPFFTTKPAGVGTGLGLSVIKKIMELHGAHIDIRNATQGGVAATLILRAA